MKTTTRTTRHTQKTLEINHTDLLRLLLADGLQIPGGAQFQATIRVPGGGDWSNCDLDLREHPVKVLIDYDEVLDG